MWHNDPELTMKLERERQEEMIRGHQRRQAAHRAKGGSGMVRTILGMLGDAMVNGGERLRRRSQMASNVSGNLPGISRDLLAY